MSIDDFGAGYTSLGQLKNLPFTELKIDKSFIMNMGKDPSAAMIVQSIIDLGHNLALTIVAEGVETSAALADLAAFGCDTAQGYYLSPSLPTAAFGTWRAARSPGDTTSSSYWLERARPRAHARKPTTSTHGLARTRPAPTSGT